MNRKSARSLITPPRIPLPWRRGGTAGGVPARELSEVDLLRELEHLHATRNEAVRHAPDDALANHTDRMSELEAEYVRRFPRREIDPHRLRATNISHPGGFGPPDAR